MARYIDLDKVEFLKADGNKEFNHGVDCCINKLLKIEPADVIERSEYEYLKKENRELAIKYDNAMNMVINEQENVTRLRSKIDKAKKIAEDCIKASFKLGLNERAFGMREILEVFEKTIGE